MEPTEDNPMIPAERELREALHATDTRVTELARVVDTRTDFIRENIREAVREALPKTMLNDDEHRWVRMCIEREATKAQFRKKIIESATLWAIITLIILLAGSLGAILREYAIKHGMWTP